MYIQSLILLRDLNGRIGREQSIVDEMSFEGPFKNVNRIRNLKDYLISQRGRKILELFNNLRLIILNGRSLSDANSEFDSIGPMGN